MVPSIVNVSTSPVDQINQMANYLRSQQIIHLTTDDAPMPDRKSLILNDREILNFTTCSYLGLETHPALKQAAIQAIEDIGVHFYVSRAYISLNMYEELENLLNRVFNNHVVILPTTALGHWSALPALIGERDAVIMDHQVHTSVQMTAKILKANGIYCELIRHNRLDYLENRIKKLSTEYEKVWYLADGIYSMYGDGAPMRELNQLLDQYQQFHLYIDDAHGMSWTGSCGAGHVLADVPQHQRTILMTSLAKAYGASGAALVTTDEAIKQKVRNCGSTLIFTGPIPPPMLAAAIASAKIHLSPEINSLQNALQNRIDFMREKAFQLGLPMAGEGNSPIFYLACGKPEVASSLCQRLKEKGFLTCVATYPSVPYMRAGIRILACVHQSFEDISSLLNEVAVQFPQVLREQNYSLYEIEKSFGLPHLPPTGLSTFAME